MNRGEAGRDGTWEDVNYEHQREKMYLLTCVPKEDSKQPTLSGSLISVFVVRMKKLCILGYPKCAQWRFWSDCANAQSDLNLHWVHMFEGTFSFWRCVDIGRPLRKRLLTETHLFLLNISTVIGRFLAVRREPNVVFVAFRDCSDY